MAFIDMDRLREAYEGSARDAVSEVYHTPDYSIAKDIDADIEQDVTGMDEEFVAVLSGTSADVVYRDPEESDSEILQGDLSCIENRILDLLDQGGCYDSIIEYEDPDGDGDAFGMKVWIAEWDCGALEGLRALVDSFGGTEMFRDDKTGKIASISYITGGKPFEYFVCYEMQGIPVYDLDELVGEDETDSDELCDDDRYESHMHVCACIDKKGVLYALYDVFAAVERELPEEIGVDAPCKVTFSRVDPDTLRHEEEALSVILENGSCADYALAKLTSTREPVIISFDV